MVSCAVGPAGGGGAAGDIAVITVCKNASAAGGAINGATAITATLSGTAAQTVTYYNTSVNFAAGDYICLHTNIQGNKLQDLVIQVDCF
jgi:hypothetical protein